LKLLGRRRRLAGLLPRFVVESLDFLVQSLYLSIWYSLQFLLHLQLLLLTLLKLTLRLFVERDQNTSAYDANRSRVFSEDADDLEFLAKTGDKFGFRGHRYVVCANNLKKLLLNLCEAPLQLSFQSSTRSLLQLRLLLELLLGESNLRVGNAHVDQMLVNTAGKERLCTA